MRKGQYIRLLLATAANPTKVIAASKELKFHGSASTEEDTNKETTGDATEYEVQELSYDITGSAQMLIPSDTLNTSAVTAADLMNYFGDTLLYWRICVMEGEHNRTIKEEIFNGQAKMTNLGIQAQTKQTVTISYTLNGYGGFNIAADAPSNNSSNTNSNSNSPVVDDSEGE